MCSLIFNSNRHNLHPFFLHSISFSSEKLSFFPGVVSPFLAATPSFLFISASEEFLLGLVLVLLSFRSIYMPSLYFHNLPQLYLLFSSWLPISFQLPRLTNTFIVLAVRLFVYFTCFPFFTPTKLIHSSFFFMATWFYFLFQCLLVAAALTLITAG